MITIPEEVMTGQGLIALAYELLSELLPEVRAEELPEELAVN